MRLLCLYWHGIGDNILATPALRRYKQANPDHHIGWIMNSRYEVADPFRNFPFVDDIYWGIDAWHCCGPNNLTDGRVVAIGEASMIKDHNDYDRLIIMDHHLVGHKIFRTAEHLGVTLKPDELHTSFWYDKEEILSYYNMLDLPKRFAFAHNKTSSPDKDMPMDWCRAQLPEDLPIVSPADWDTTTTPIAFAADVMARAEYRILADSALYHIAHAMDLPVYKAYFGRGSAVWDIVHPLHDVRDNVVFALNGQ